MSALAEPRVAAAAAGAPPAPRRELLTVLGLRVLAGVIICVLWQVCVGAFAPSYIARPWGVIRDIGPVLGDTTFLHDLGSTLLAVVEGLAIAAAIGLVVGLLMGRMPDVRRALGIYVNSFYAMPMIALVPLLTVWFGYSPTTRLVVVVIEAILPIVYNVAEGAASVPRTFIEVARIHRAQWWRVWFGIAVPAAVPYLLAGVDLAIGRALVGAVAAEFIASIAGAGYYIDFNVHSFQENNAMVALLVLVVFAVALRGLMNLFVKRSLPWYRPMSGKGMA